MRNEQEEREQIGARIVNNINFLINRTGATYKDFEKFCKEKKQIEINLGNLSHRLNKKVKMDFLTLSLLCQWLEVDMQEVIWKEYDEVTHILDKAQLFKDTNAFVVENTDNQFEKYEGEYYCYFHPTIHEEKEIVTGHLRIKVDKYTGRCRTELEIWTNQPMQGKEGKYVKKYQGAMVLAREKGVCYCIVSNGRIGECNFISFRHKKPNNKDYLGGMAIVSTISAGGSNVPTVHRMLISRKEVSPEEMKYISGNLLLNESKIMVEKEKMEGCLEELGIAEDIQGKILGNAKLKEMYQFSESYLRSLEKEELQPHTREEVISHIRSASIAMRYNKVSEKVDENIIKLLENTVKG